jgi:hypothetical protein
MLLSHAAGWEAPVHVVIVVDGEAICLRLLLQEVRLAASRAFRTAGRSKPSRTAMMAITTSRTCFRRLRSDTMSA